MRRMARGGARRGVIYIYIYLYLYILIYIYTGGGDHPTLLSPLPSFLPCVRLTTFCTISEVKTILHLQRGLNLHFSRCLNLHFSLGYNCDVIDLKSPFYTYSGLTDLGVATGVTKFRMVSGGLNRFINLFGKHEFEKICTCCPNVITPIQKYTTKSLRILLTIFQITTTCVCVRKCA